MVDTGIGQFKSNALSVIFKLGILSAFDQRSKFQIFFFVISVSLKIDTSSYMGNITAGNAVLLTYQQSKTKSILNRSPTDRLRIIITQQIFSSSVSVFIRH